MQKNNYPYRISYILVILFFLLGAVFYRQSFLAVLFIMLILLPIISIYITVLLNKKLTLHVVSETPQVTKGNNIILKISIDNASLFPFQNCAVHYEAYNHFCLHKDNKPEYILILPGKAKKEVSVTMSVSTGCAGMSIFNFTELRITDPLHLYTIVRPLSILLQIPVFPKEIKNDYPIFPGMYFDDENDEYMDYSGQLSQDIKEIRDYRPGDQLTSIHWKISAKEDELMVKEMERMAPRTLLLLAELEVMELDNTLETYYSYMMHLLANGEIFKTVLYNYKLNEFEICVITNQHQCMDFLLKLFFMPVYREHNKAARAFIEHFCNSDSFQAGNFEGNGIIQIYSKSISVYSGQ